MSSLRTHSMSSSYNTTDSFHTAEPTSEHDGSSQTENLPGDNTISQDSEVKSSTSTLEHDPLSPDGYVTHPTKYEPQAVNEDDFPPDLEPNSRRESITEISRELSKVLTNAKSIEERIKKQEEAGVPIPPMGGGKDYPPMLPDKEPYVVAFDGEDDPFHPHNWPLSTKVIQCAIIGVDTFCIAFGSAVFSEAVPQIAEKYHVANVVATLGITLYVLGFATGPVIWAPLSELYGRRPVMLLSSIAFASFNFAVACSDRLESILICRFFAGCLGAAPMVVAPAGFADMFGNRTRGTAMVVFSMAVFVGPLLAPFIGGFTVANPKLGWRWTEFITAIIASANVVLVLLFQRETHHPILLVQKAREIKRRTNNWGIHAPHDEFQLSVKEIVENNLSRPLKMLFTEPIIFFVSLYNAFIYGMLYLFLTAYPFVFQEGYKMAPGVAELPYFGMVVGEVIGGCFCIYREKAYVRALEANKGKVIPEARLPTIIWGGVAFPIGILWFSWTGNYHKDIHWIVPTISGIFTGFGLMGIFIPSMNYIIDSYLIFAASAMAANTFLRSSFGGVFPLFASFMFKNMHTNWAGLLLGLFSIALIACPILFVMYGKKLRQKSKYAFDL
ncbi:hypothetical protein KL931_000280 [Ogataea haglerorum]|nr:hypothetical protein KL951_000279 [Ogataea haglerorum]KAG7722460.1 hypothetical protein KL913_000280 [Ogataea haglerorum]KAG7751090.1 hypothetical protein KL912_000223 [Ogataea haglerorum]KAG7771940.1 hypothetical protein KL931_000280 [Ogataea haglerorum]KAG7803986.1 hypothetical protein KL944_000855 [Ogataea haglerorum]